MKKSFISLIVITAVFFISVDVCSQSSVSIHAGPAFPLSHFNDDDDGGAAIGFNIGMRYSYLITDYRLGVYADVDFNYNGETADIDEVKLKVSLLTLTLGIKF